MGVHRAPRIYQLTESVGGQTVAAGGSGTVQFDTEARPLAGITFSGGTTITINGAQAEGLWRVGYGVAAVCSNNSRSSFFTFLLLNGSELPFTRGGLYLRNASSLDDASRETFVDLVVGNTLQLFVTRLSGGGSSGAVIQANGASILMERVE